MKTISFLIFFSIIMSVYGLLSYYVYIRGYQALEALPGWKTGYSVLFWFLSFSYVAARFLEKVWMSPLTDFLNWTGALWLGAFIYLLLFTLAFDLYRLAAWALPALSLRGQAEPSVLRLTAFGVTFFSVLLIVISGYFIAKTPVVTDLVLKVDKKAPGMKSLRIAAASDIHLGTIIGKNRLTKIVRGINSLNPDIILLAGDVVDEDLAPVIRRNLGEHLLELKAPLGVWAVTGNHEYIGGVEPAVQYLEAHGIRVLRDSVLSINGHFYLAGREDRDIIRFAGRNRKELPELLAGIDLALPLLLMDHQPFSLEKAALAGVDLQLSGHTHHGQIWPFNYLTEAIYELSWGYLKKGSTHFYVSCGVGSWGPPIRHGNRPEILNIVLQFN